MKALFLLAFSLTNAFFFVNDITISGKFYQISEYPQLNLTEKVHIHIDKQQYFAGEDIWFKAYVKNAKTGELTSYSKVLYVELLNPSDKIEQKLILPLENGLGWGDFKLPEAYATGSYRLRAYTNLMKNGGQQSYFDQQIQIVSQTYNYTQLVQKPRSSDNLNSKLFELKNNKGESIPNLPVEIKIINSNNATSSFTKTSSSQGEIEIPMSADASYFRMYASGKDGQAINQYFTGPLKKSKTDIQFLPEGGQLVKGIRSKIAIKVVNEFGLGIKSEGTIIDQNQIESGRFITSDLGMGAFFLIPEPGKQYRAKITSEGGINSEVSLPVAKNSGYTLSINDVDSTLIKATVKLTDDLVGNDSLELLIHRNGLIYSQSKFDSKIKTIEIEIEKKGLPNGVVTTSLFSAGRKLLNERVFFSRNPFLQVDSKISLVNGINKSGDSVSLTFKNMINGQPYIGHFSVSVTDITDAENDYVTDDNILTNLLLKSELQGYIEKPSFYFNKENKHATEALDFLMLTQGWRNVSWDDVEKKNKASNLTYKAETGLDVIGSITNKNVPFPGSNVTLLNNLGAMNLFDTVSDSHGRFIFENLHYPDSTKFILQARGLKDLKDVQINLDLPTLDSVSAFSNFVWGTKNKPLNLAHFFSEKQATQEASPIKTSKSMVLNEVQIVDKKKYVNLAPNSKNLNGPGNADVVVDVSQIYLSNNVALYLRGRVPSVKISPDGSAESYKVRGTTSSFASHNQKMGIILDGIRMGQDFTLNALNPQIIESIEVLTSPSKLAIYGASSSTGLFIVTTKEEERQKVISYKAPGMLTFFPKGYYASRSFYTPKYIIHQDTKRPLPYTVFWKPDLVSEDNGNLIISYQNPKQTGKFQMIIEGIDIDGNIFRHAQQYDLK